MGRCLRRRGFCHFGTVWPPPALPSLSAVGTLRGLHGLGLSDSVYYGRTRLYQVKAVLRLRFTTPTANCKEGGSQVRTGQCPPRHDRELDRIPLTSPEAERLSVRCHAAWPLSAARDDFAPRGWQRSTICRLNPKRKLPCAHNAG
eukprot:4166331-Prymnesium_polylepis.1